MHAVNHSLLLAWSLQAQAVRYVVWIGLVALTCYLLVLARTQWGQSNPLRKCIVLSLLAHLLVGIYATTVQIVTAGPRGGGATSIVLVDSDGEAVEGPPEGTADEAPSQDDPAAPPQPADSEQTPPANPPAQKEDPATAPAAAKEITAVASASPASIPPAPPTPAASAGPGSSGDKTAATVDVPPPDALPAEAADPEPPPVKRADLVPVSSGSSPTATKPSAPSTAAAPGAELAPLNAAAKAEELAAAERHLPQIYADRMARDHVRVAEEHGGSEETEAAVGAALKFLVANQSPDGRWSCRALGGGHLTSQDGHNRQGAGSQADTGITGLCLLSLLAAGHTHLQGAYDEPVRRGLEFLLRSQAADGNLAGRATLFERMYCHGMAAFALSEAYAMTSDERLQPAVRAAVHYTLSSQDRATGGWRYQPHDPGDMSQFGWQAMALKSAALGSIAMPNDSRDLMRRFLKSVATGRQGGLAGYRPGHPASRPMTAEHLVCLQFMGLEPDDPVAREAGDYLLSELPGQGEPNVYYWYYGTLGMYQLQGDYWRRWNAALQAQLLATQRRDAKRAGSWDPDSVWGAYGGRAYSTALSTLCLEVYYRFLPLYVAHGGQKPTPERQ